jgi:hypothetical protein
LLLLDDQFFDSDDFVCRQAVTSREPHRIEPKLCFTVVPFHMHMWRLVSISSVKEQSVRAASENCGHLSMLRPPTGDGNVI